MTSVKLSLCQEIWGIQNTEISNRENKTKSITLKKITQKFKTHETTINFQTDLTIWE